MRYYPIPVLRPALGLGALLALSCVQAQSSNYAAFELSREENWSPLLTEDLNGDGLLDLVYSVYSEAGGRELLIHYQDANGNFPDAPQRIEIKSEILAIGFGDLRAEPGSELILHAANGVFSLSAGVEGYGNNLEPIMRFDSIASIASTRSVEFLPTVQSRDGDEFPDLLLPQAEGFAFFRGTQEGFVAAGTVKSVNDSLALARRNDREAELDTQIGINAEEGLSIRVAVERRSPFDDFVDQWHGAKADGAVLDSEHWIPNAVFADFDGDTRQDLAFINLDEEAQPLFNIAYQGDKGFAEPELWSMSLEAGGEIQLADFDGDGRQDLLRLAGDGDEWEARFFRSRGAFDLSDPDQIMRFAGYDVRLEPLPLPGGQVALSVSYYTLPVVDAIRNASINRSQLLYAPLAGNDAPNTGAPLFERRPASQLVESFSAANVRGLSEQMSLRYDVDGDGARDALYITERGTLAAKRIDSSLRIADEPFWEYTSNKTVFEFEVLPLNDDATPDLILRHGNAITVLVSRGGVR